MTPNETKTLGEIFFFTKRHRHENFKHTFKIINVKQYIKKIIHYDQEEFIPKRQV